MWPLLLNLIPLLATGYSDLRLNPILNASAVELGKENGVSENELNETHRICTKPDVVYQSAGPVSIYLNGGLVQQGGKESVINFTADNTKCSNCPQGPPGPKGDRGPQGPQGPRGDPGPPGGGDNGTHVTDTFVAFSVVMEARPFGPYSYYKIIQFDNVISNVGSGYNEDKGVFTARIPGYYQFTVHAHTVVNKQAEVRVMFNSERVVSVWADGTIGHQEGNTAQKAPMSPFMSAPTPKSTPKQVHEMGSSNSFIIKMSRGQKVYCLLPANQVLAGLGFSSFSGHLLRVTSD